MTRATETYHFDWEGIALTVNWTTCWLNTEVNGHQVAHLEVIADDRVSLPITETGYRSHFNSCELVDGEGGAVAYVRKWLDVEAMTEKWRKHVEAARQLSLF